MEQNCSSFTLFVCKAIALRSLESNVYNEKGFLNKIMCTQAVLCSIATRTAKE